MNENSVKFDSFYFQKSGEEFKKGFRYAIRCLLDIIKNKENYTMDEHIKFLSDFIRIDDIMKEKLK